MQCIPSILIVSSSNTKPKSLIKLLTKQNPREDDSGLLVSQPWRIDTKYYTAETNIIGVCEDYIRNAEFNNQVEALIMLMDCNKQSGLDDLKRWQDIENDCEPEVKLLVSNYCNKDTKITKDQVMEWCLKHSFEFVELYPTKVENDDDEAQDIIEEKFGVHRIIEALETHTWSNLVMKSKTSVSKKHDNEMQVNNNPENVDESEYSKDAVDDFTELFSQLHLMKDSLQSMPVSQRKQCAEQMVTAFWKAIGGEEEELLDI